MLSRKVKQERKERYWFTRREAAEVIGVHPVTMCRWASARFGPKPYLDPTDRRKYIYKKSDVAKFMEERIPVYREDGTEDTFTSAG